jgi:uncharacterized protein YggE
MNKLGTTLISLLVVLFLTAGLVFFSPVSAKAPAQQTTDGETMRTISVVGSGSASTQPDIAYVTVGVRTEAEEASEALSQNNQQMNDLIDTLLEAGLSTQDIRTQTINLFPQYSNEPNQTGQLEVIGYTATNTVEVRVSDIAEVGQILDTAVQQGSNLIENIRFDVSDSTEPLQQAREAAFNDARQKAEQLAELAGVQLGQVNAIYETSSQPPVPFATEGRAFAADQAVPVEPGTQDVQVSLQVTWEIAAE